MANIDVSSSYSYFKSLDIFSLMTSKNFSKENYDITEFLNKDDQRIDKENLSKEIHINISKFWKQIIIERLNQKKIIFQIRNKIHLKKFIKFFYLFFKHFKYSKNFNILCKTSLSDQLLIKNYKDLKGVINFLKNY